jgi:hypothetical protein
VKKIAIALLTLGLFLAAAALAQEKVQESPQFVLRVSGTEDGRMYVVSDSSTIFFSVKSSSPTAPLTKGDFLICHVHDFKDSAGVTHVSFKCGADEYIVQTVGIRSKEKEAKVEKKRKAN